MVHTNCTYQSARHSRILISKTSEHATKRIQQRGINNDDILLVLAFGVKEHDGMGATRHLMTKSAVKRLCASVGKTAKATALEGMYAVVSTADNTVITVGHRYH
jgi:hypothetical protein